MNKKYKISYFFQGGRKERLLKDTPYAKEMFYGYHYFNENYEDVSLTEFTLEHSVLRRVFFRYIEKPLRTLLKLPLYWSFVITKKHFSELKKSDYSIFSSNRIGCSILPFVIFLKLTKNKTKYLCFILGLLSRKPKYKFFEIFQNFYIKVFFKFIDKFIFLSEGEYNLALQKYPKYKKKYFLLPFAIDTDMWKFKSKKDKNKKILFVGNDGFRDFQLAEKLSSELVDFEFVYVSQNISENNINKSNSIIKKGSWGDPYLSDEQLRKEYHEAFLTIIPLKDSYQPSGQSVALQSLSCGTPVLITQTVGFWDNENLKNEKNIFFIESNKIIDWKQKIEYLFSLDTDQINKIVKDGRNTIEKLYSVDEFSKKIEEILIN